MQKNNCAATQITALNQEKIDVTKKCYRKYVYLANLFKINLNNEDK